MNKAYGIVVAHLPATINHFLAATFHFRVIPLDRRKVQVLVAGSGIHGRCSAAAQTNQHGRAAEDDQLGPHRNIAFLHMVRPDITQAASDHDGLVITAYLFATGTGRHFLKGPEIPGEIGTAELIVEGSTANGTFNHDIQRRGNSFRLPVTKFPGLRVIRDVKVGYREPAEARLRLGTTPGCPFITDLTTRTGCSTSRRRYRGRMVVGFHFHQDMDIFLMIAIHTGFGLREETPPTAAGDDRRVVLISGKHALAVHLKGIANHRKQGFLLPFAVDIPGGVENLVAAMF